MTRSGSRRFMAAAVLAAAACRGKGPPAAAEVVPVRVAKVVQKAVPLQIRNVGTIQRYVAVSVRAQVSGEITQVHFREGQDVKQGRLLFSIDPRPYEAALAEAEAALARDRALCENAADGRQALRRPRQEGLRDAAAVRQRQGQRRGDGRDRAASTRRRSNGRASTSRTARSARRWPAGAAASWSRPATS